MQYIVLDLEMCRVNQQYNSKFACGFEIIQIGAVRMTENYELQDEFSAYVKPEYGKLDHFIEDLTGIHGGKLKNANRLASVLAKFMDWIGEEDTTYVAWSETDRSQLSKEITLKEIRLPKKDADQNDIIDSDRLTTLLDPENWLDFQKMFGDRFGFDHAVKLSDALTMADIMYEGSKHDGLCDAYNTAKLMAAVQLDPDFKLTLEELGAREEETVHLKTSLGDLLAGFTFS